MTDEICRASESTAAQMKEVNQTDPVSAVSWKNTPYRQVNKRDNNSTEQMATKECGNCGQHYGSPDERGQPNGPRERCKLEEYALQTSKQTGQ